MRGADPKSVMDLKVNRMPKSSRDAGLRGFMEFDFCHDTNEGQGVDFEITVQRLFFFSLFRQSSRLIFGQGFVQFAVMIVP